MQGRLRQTLSELGQATAGVIDPVLQPDEVPEMRDQVTDHSQGTAGFGPFTTCTYAVLHRNSIIVTNTSAIASMLATVVDVLYCDRFTIIVCDLLHRKILQGP